ncbi:MAG: BamA/TamA family outer membrane protein [Flavobacterium sp.]|nr:BamA/TamA family outer membrane protein [Candidatus Neoflavobacterium equi]
MGLFLYACSSTKKVPNNSRLLTKNVFTVNGTPDSKEELGELMYQKPNTALLGVPASLHIYNLAKNDPDSSFQAWLASKPGRYDRLSRLLSEKQVARLGKSFFVAGISNFLKENGQPPVIFDSTRTVKSKDRLRQYYYNQGYFDNKVTFTQDTTSHKKVKVYYSVQTGDAYIVDSISRYINSPELDSLYNASKNASLIKRGKQYNTQDFTNERSRLSNFFRNNGAYKFQETYINYEIDTTVNKHKANVEVIIEDYTKKSGDTLIREPFLLYKISRVNIFTDNASSKKENIVDSVAFKKFNLYSTAKLNYKPKAITDAVFITEGSTYSDMRRSLTTQALGNLRIFKYPRIEYIEDPADSTKKSLITNIYLVPEKKYQLNASIDFMHSNIQEFGVIGSAGLSIRNLFGGAEILDISSKLNIGSSGKVANPNDVFFNISEYGADVKLTFPRLLFPFNTDKYIPKIMFPTTVASFGITRQTNIGLDKESFTGIFNYNWKPKRYNTMRVDLFNIQYVRNLNPNNYFTVYKSSYNKLNELAQVYNTNPDYINENGNLDRDNGGTQGFINDVLDGTIQVPSTNGDFQNVRSIDERRRRLTEDNLIFATNITYLKSTRTGLKDNDFSTFRTKVENAGNIASLLSKMENAPKNQNGNHTLLDVEYSQYFKTEFEFIKWWEIGKKQIIATRSFIGIAVPYGNSNYIPFSRSYFAGGTNDNRAWQPYSLGPGSSGGINDFNEANLKIAFSAEYRFNIFGKLNGAIFTDIGNIWNVLDNVKDPASKFSSLSSLKDIAVGTGFGGRYDFNFFIVRLDLGFKTYNPAYEMERRWFKDLKFSESILNIGINYPF